VNTSVTYRSSRELFPKSAVKLRSEMAWQSIRLLRSFRVFRQMGCAQHFPEFPEPISTVAARKTTFPLFWRINIFHNWFTGTRLPPPDPPAPIPRNWFTKCHPHVESSISLLMSSWLRWDVTVMYDDVLRTMGKSLYQTDHSSFLMHLMSFDHWKSLFCTKLITHSSWSIWWVGKSLFCTKLFTSSSWGIWWTQWAVLSWSLDFHDALEYVGELTSCSIKEYYLSYGGFLCRCLQLIPTSRKVHYITHKILIITKKTFYLFIYLFKTRCTYLHYFKRKQFFES